MLQGIVTRQLKNHRPVTTWVIKENAAIEPTVDDQREYFIDTANDAVNEFKEQFIEFKGACFYLDIMDGYGKLAETHVL